MSSEVFTKSHPTGLTKGSKLNLLDPAQGGSSSKNIYTVVSDTVTGRTSWSGKRMSNCATGEVSWVAVKGQQGPTGGKVKLSQPGKDPIDAKFTLVWNPETHVEVDKCRIPGTPGHGSSAKNGKKRTLHWTMNVVLTIDIAGVKYQKSIKSHAFKKQCKCVAG